MIRQLAQYRHLQRCLLLLMLALMILAASYSNSYAQESDCGPGITLQHTFSSGASWSLCANVSGINGLEISNAFFRAPGDLNRSVLAQGHLSQILLHYHDRIAEEAQIRPSSTETSSTHQPETVTLNDQNCDGLIRGTMDEPDSICIRVKTNGILAKYDQRPSLQSEAWELSNTLSRETLTWNNSWTFTEDGQIRPRLSLSGRSSRRNSNEQFAQQTRQDIPEMTRATILSTWRIVPALDTSAPDTVEQFDYPLDIDSGNRRPIQITPIVLESLGSMNRDNFRGWRILDASGAGYYLDPANNGFSFVSRAHNWANFDIAFTRENPCELYAHANPIATNDSACGANLDEFVNDEPLVNTNIAIWFNQTRTLDPSVEDWPVIRDVQLGFDLLPFDWTSNSPFELVE